MAFESLLHEIDAQISRLQQAKSVLSGTEVKRSPGRLAKYKTIAQGGGNEKRIPVGVISPNGSNEKRILSPKARKAIGDAQRARWAKVKAAAKTAKKS
jgi:hypothetical protein